MRSLVCREFGPLAGLSVLEIPVPTPGAKQVRIDVKAATLNFPDGLMVRGLY